MAVAIQGRSPSARTPRLHLQIATAQDRVTGHA
jgi:hypothetical protein